MANEPRSGAGRSDGDASSLDRPPERREALGFAGDVTWFDAVENLLDATIDHDEEVVCTFERFELDVPVRMGADASRARWRLDGTVAVSVEGTRGPLAEWLEWWSRRVD